MSSWEYVAEATAIPINEGRKIIFGEKEMAIFNVGSEFIVIDNLCPHKQGPLADGIVSGRTVACPLHNLVVNLDNGCAIKGGEGQVGRYAVKVETGRIYVSLEN